MKPVSRPVKYLALFILLLGPVIAFFIVSRGQHEFYSLPIYGPKEVQYLDDGKADTLYHTIPDFKLVNQFGDTLTNADFEGKIRIVDFFFSTCPTICPVMTKNMAALQLELDEDHFRDVKMVSHTVNPEFDTPEVLFKYGEKHDADFDLWTFLTGNKEDIYRLGVLGYMLPAQEDALAPGGFLHSEQFVLVDPKGRIRGYYDGTKIAETRRMMKDVKMLIKNMKDEQKQ